jgi:hypothetical protein
MGAGARIQEAVSIEGGAIIDLVPPRERRLVAVQKLSVANYQIA